MLKVQHRHRLRAVYPGNNERGRTASWHPRLAHVSRVDHQKLNPLRELIEFIIDFPIHMALFQMSQNNVIGGTWTQVCSAYEGQSLKTSVHSTGPRTRCESIGSCWLWNPLVLNFLSILSSTTSRTSETNRLCVSVAQWRKTMCKFNLIWVLGSWVRILAWVSQLNFRFFLHF